MINKFKKLRKELGVTQRQLEKEIGIGQGTISYYERTDIHKSLIFYINLIEFAKKQGKEIDINYLLTD